MTEPLKTMLLAAVRQNDWDNLNAVLDAMTTRDLDSAVAALKHVPGARVATLRSKLFAELHLRGATDD